MLSNISYKDHVTNEEVCRKIQAAIRKYDELLTMVKNVNYGKIVWPCLKVFWFSKDNSLGPGEWKKKKQNTEEEMGKYQRVDRDGLCQLN